MPASPTSNAVLVLGAGVGGMRAANDLAEAGLPVFLVEDAPTLGGRVAQLGIMFPTHDCVLCRGTTQHTYGCTRPSISPSLLDQNRHPNIEVLTNTRALAAEGEAGNFTVRLLRRPRYVDPERCINCGLCAQACPVSLPSEFQAGLSRRRAAYKPSLRAIPDAYLIDKGPYCDGCALCAACCPTHAINLDEEPTEIVLHVGAVVLALGCDSSGAQEYEEYGWGRYQNVIDSMQYERLASRSGPTGGMIARPSDANVPARIAWLQCIGSRDQKYPYCSSICCMSATKEAILATELIPGVQCRVFIVDERAFNKHYESYFQRARDESGIEYVRCRPSSVREDPSSRNLLLRYVEPDGGVVDDSFDMVVLSSGMRPYSLSGETAGIFGVKLNRYGFCETGAFAPLQTGRPGVFVCGAFQSPKEISETVIDGAGVAAQVIRLLARRRRAVLHPPSHEYPFVAPSAGSPLPDERDVSEEPPRVGVFVCRCLPSIDGAVNTQGLVAYAAGLPGVAHASRVDYGCLDDGPGRIRAAIAEHRLNRVVVAGCSRRTHGALFERLGRECGLNPSLVDLVNIREQCAWVHGAEPRAATHKAMEMVRASVARLRVTSSTHKESVRPARKALVVGGGVAGMSAALAIADSGFGVVLVERELELGGNLRRLYSTPGGDPRELMLELTGRVRRHGRITVLTSSQLVRHGGRVGDFRSVVRTFLGNGDGRTSERTVRHAATIVATGGQEWRGDAFMLGTNPRVVTALDLEERLAVHPEQTAGLREVVLLHCVRPPDAPAYCSRICCSNSLKNALQLKQTNPRCRVVVLHREMMTYGFQEQLYTEARASGVICVRYDGDSPPAVRERDGRLSVTVRDQTLRETLSLSPDLLVLNTAVVPSPGTARLAAMLGLPLSPEGFFKEAHLKLRPVDSGVEGVFVAGMAHYPSFIQETIAQAQAAAGRALAVLAQERLYFEGSVAVVDPANCTACLTCVRTCPFGAARIAPAQAGVGGLCGAAYIEPARCQGCGICAAECPARAIQLVDCTDEQVLAQGLGAWLAPAAVQHLAGAAVEKETAQ